ncbi:uncharacterized protein LOC121389176 [Gigantopelta aegis]|uniref:uncharacterized protein LOC121389176 n=1 Tax=Gigantopelta aegis TaxID=1735272 RepID=UPI001B88D788|nr:uncharacterized protein LOC121389176 [Gigantopelta aegis]
MVAKKPDQLCRIEDFVKKRTRNRQKKVLVKWLHWPKKYNSWIPEADVVRYQTTSTNSQATLQGKEQFQLLLRSFAMKLLLVLTCVAIASCLPVSEVINDDVISTDLVVKRNVIETLKHAAEAVVDKVQHLDAMTVLSGASKLAGIASSIASIVALFGKRDIDTRSFLGDIHNCGIRWTPDCSLVFVRDVSERNIETRGFLDNIWGELQKVISHIPTEPIFLGKRDTDDRRQIVTVIDPVVKRNVIETLKHAAEAVVDKIQHLDAMTVLSGASKLAGIASSIASIVALFGKRDIDTRSFVGDTHNCGIRWTFGCPIDFARDVSERDIETRGFLDHIWGELQKVISHIPTEPIFIGKRDTDDRRQIVSVIDPALCHGPKMPIACFALGKRNIDVKRQIVNVIDPSLCHGPVIPFACFARG